MAALNRHNLPLELSSFVGRGKEISQVRQTMRQARLLTLTGAGGCGKTRLAIRAAQLVANEYAHGVRMIDLAHVTSPESVPHLVASVAQVQIAPDLPLLTALAEALRPKQMLLLLDNCEHLIDACAALAEAILRACPRVSILVTSREPLGVAGEIVRPVPPLPFPGEADRRSSIPLLQYDACRLFVERALERLPSYSPSRSDEAAIARICTRLEGIPLAIELAAARISVLSVDEIASRLDNHLSLLTDGPRTAPQRHQTLRATIDWSHALLSLSEQRFWRRLSVFPGTFTASAAEAICSGAGIDAADVLTLLSQLAGKSLVAVSQHEREKRFGLPETIRQYCAERLLASGEEPDCRRRHRDWYLALAVDASPQLTGQGQSEWMDRLEREYSNLRAALTSFQTAADAATGVQMARALLRYWEVRGQFSEGRAQLLRLLELTPGPSAERAAALEGAGLLAREQGDYPAAQAYYAECLQINRVIGDKEGVVVALRGLGNVAALRGELDQAGRLYQESLLHARELGEQQAVARSLGNLAVVDIFRGEYETARTRLTECLGLLRQLGDQPGVVNALFNLGVVAEEKREMDLSEALFLECLQIGRELGYKANSARCLNSLGAVARRRGNLAEAGAFLDEARSVASEIGDRRSLAESLLQLGLLDIARGEISQAVPTLSESIRAAHELGDKWLLGDLLHAFAEVAFRHGRLERSAQLMAAAENLRIAIGIQAQQDRQNEIQPMLDQLRGALGPAWEKAQTAGRSLTQPEAVALALSCGQSGARPESGPAATDLTPQEVRIIRFIALGFTSAEIGEHLSLSRRTVEKHREHIRSKLNCSSRAGLVAWAMQHQLVVEHEVGNPGSRHGKTGGPQRPTAR